MNICNPFLLFFIVSENLIPLTFVQDNSTSNRANLTKFSELTLEAFVLGWTKRIVFYLVQVKLHFCEIDRRSLMLIACQTFITAQILIVLVQPLGKKI